MSSGLQAQFGGPDEAAGALHRLERGRPIPADNRAAPRTPWAATGCQG
jgi:hypothetical protein